MVASIRTFKMGHLVQSFNSFWCNCYFKIVHFCLRGKYAVQICFASDFLYIINAYMSRIKHIFSLPTGF